MLSSESPEHEFKTQDVANAYNQNYRSPNFFKYRRWICRPFIRALVKKARLEKGSRVLDIGCGQGFFTSIFTELGMQALGVDISGEAIRSANKEFGSSGAKFEVGDVMNLPYRDAFDCAFVRNCSLYNSMKFEINREATDGFLRYVKPGGVFIFDYNTKLRRTDRRAAWRSLSIAAVENHFSIFTQAEVYFSIRLDAVLLRSLALSYPITRLAALVSWVTGIGGELLTIVRKK